MTPPNAEPANTPPKPIRVLITDDHPVVRKGLAALLAEHDDIELVGEASDGLQAIEQAIRLNPDVVLMDLLMPNLDGIEAIRQIALVRPEERILVLTSVTADEKVLAAIKAGATGYLLKESPAEVLIGAIRQVNRGELSLPPLKARKVLLELSGVKEEDQSLEALTERELEVLRLLASGMENEEIAASLNIAEVTVRTHVSHLLAKLGLANRVQATLYALRKGLVSLDDTE